MDGWVDKSKYLFGRLGVNMLNSIN